MIGFKSFAEKTKVKFQPGFTALVGPNGCGKSNVVDAVRWVLGEKSARSMRGEKMEDVIFAGTDQMKPLSMAEVSLEFDNSGGLLPIDGNTLTVARRLYRDGESEYLVNGRQVRLKEIEALFYDTGVGKNTYSVMEQGKIDQIISTKPEERRYIFEEAAGVSRYKHQKKESVKKLEETKRNVSRIQDILHEVERDRNHKQKQAERTERYQELNEQLSIYKIKKHVQRSSDFLARAEELEKKMGELVRRREELSAKVSSVNSIIEQKEYKKNAIQLELFEQDKQLVSYQHSLQYIDERISRNKSLLQDAEERLARSEAQIAQKKQNLDDLENKINQESERGGRLEKELSEMTEVIRTKEDEQQRLTGQINDWSETIKTNRQSIDQIEKNLKEEQEQLKVVIGKLVIEIEKRKQELEQEESERQVYRSRLYEWLDSTRAKSERLIEQLSENAEAQSLRHAVRDFVTHLDLDSFQNDLKAFESFEDGFRSIFFAKGGIQEQKEEIQTRIEQGEADREAHLSENNRLEESIQQGRERLENLKEELKELHVRNSKQRNELDWVHKQLNQFHQQKKDLQEQVQSFQSEIDLIKSNIEDWKKEIAEFEEQLQDFSGKESSLRNQMRQLTEERDSIEQEVSRHKTEIHRENVELDKVKPKIDTYEKSLMEIRLKDEQLKEQIYNQYELDYQEALRRAQEIDLEGQALTSKIDALKKEINELGVINHLAVDEYNELNERYQFYNKQYEDLLKAQTDIYAIIADIDKASLELFNKSFEDIRKSFESIFQLLFNGGSADILLMDPDNPLESGIDIVVHPPGKRPKHISLLSGGEKSLVAIALLFSIYEIKPSPFCFLDEIDAALDEQNVDRFIKLLQKFSDTSQFIIITHNKKTMSMANTIYGITMDHPGISSIISLQLEKTKKGEEKLKV